MLKQIQNVDDTYVFFVCRTAKQIFIFDIVY